MVYRKHAAIVWNTEAAVFELECLSATKCVYVNGESYDNVKGVAANTIFPSTDGTSMKPYMSLGHVKIPIYSKDVIQVGSRIFHFLLAALSSNKRQHLEHPYEQRRDIVRSLQSTFPMRQTLCKDDEDAWEYSNMMQDVRSNMHMSVLLYYMLVHCCGYLFALLYDRNVYRTLPACCWIRFDLTLTITLTIPQ